MVSWIERREFPLNRESLDGLLANHIPAVRIRGFATIAECAAFAAAMRHGRIKSYGVETPINYIGMAQYEFRWGTAKRDYFDAVAAANADRDQVFQASFDPMRRLIERTSSVWPQRVAVAEDSGRPYFAGIIRFASAGIALHADYAPFNMPGYSVDAIDSQLAWNLFVEAPTAGGVTTIYNTPWSPKMEPGQPPQSYGLNARDVAGAETFTYEPAVGDVVIFNGRNPHEVSPGSDGGPGRLQIGSFIGRMPDRTLVLFS